MERCECELPTDMVAGIEFVLYQMWISIEDLLRNVETKTYSLQSSFTKTNKIIGTNFCNENQFYSSVNNVFNRATRRTWALFFQG